jgi:hypothetical protein
MPLGQPPHIGIVPHLVRGLKERRGKTMHPHQQRKKQEKKEER